MDDKNISQAVVARLPRYYRYLGDLRGSGIERISSQDLSKLMNVTASQIRQDFKAIWNFAHVDLKVPESIVVENVHLSDSLMKLSYGIANQ